MSTAAEIAVERVGGVVVAHLTGEVDTTNASYVGTELRDVVSNDAFGLVVDLTRTRYIDSAGIELLFKLARSLAQRRQTMRLVVPGDSPLRRVLLLTEIQTAAPVHETLDSALAGT